ncbi:MAG: ATP-grasp domain-containing protein [Leptolyngbya sp. SIO3F4]|nr:ATP-grasp domain-containing protein [Leptolyngbya sp. SIO3F4]
MSKPIRWLIDLHPDFPASNIVAAYLKSCDKTDPIIMDRRAVMLGDWPQTADWIVGYGTMHTMNRLMRYTPLNIGVFDDYASLRCSKYYGYIHSLLRRDFLFAPFGSLPYLPLQKMFGERFFVRSDTNYKLFPAEVLSISELSQWVDTYRDYAHELAVVAEVVKFDIEYRCFCRNGRFFCGSSYPTEPYAEVPQEIQIFAEGAAQVLADTGMNMLTIDVGLCEDEPCIVEIGGVNSWGLYGANVDNFVITMEEEARERWDDFI